MIMRYCYIASVLLSALLIDPRHRCTSAFLTAKGVRHSSRLSRDVSQTVEFAAKSNIPRNIPRNRNRNTVVRCSPGPSEENTPSSVLAEEGSSTASVDDAPAPSAAELEKEVEKPNREYSIQILNAIEELNREEWNNLLDENSR